MHMVDGSPAEFSNGAIWFAARRGRPCLLATSLRQIRREQKINRVYDAENGHDGEFSYGYQRVAAPGATAEGE